uniref:Translocon-associated protein subunit alpha n=1 Tax=Setaria digitata TaxID=48799 RepID=A0A915Q261_9BILA
MSHTETDSTNSVLTLRVNVREDTLSSPVCLRKFAVVAVLQRSSGNSSTYLTGSSAVAWSWQCGGNAGFAVVNGDDEVDGEIEEETPVNEEDIAVLDEKISSAAEVDSTIRPSPDVHVAFIFIQPENSEDLPGGKLVQFLMGFQNRGEKDFTVRFCETSFRYPQDFSYHIQNFSRVQYNRVVSAKQEATFNYAFYPSDQFAGRPLGLVVELQYEDSDGKTYRNTVFNETITIIEDESNFNTETGFLYVIFAAVVVLILLAGQHFLSKLTRKHGMAKSRQVQPIEVGTNNKNEVDFEWIPREVLNHNKSPKPGLSRQRKQAQRLE